MTKKLDYVTATGKKAPNLRGYALDMQSGRYLRRFGRGSVPCQDDAEVWTMREYDDYMVHKNFPAVDFIEVPELLNDLEELKKAEEEAASVSATLDQRGRNYGPFETGAEQIQDM
jgi:hypothetical protein